MKEREVENLVSNGYFVSVLRRMADALERGESFRVQVKGRRFVVPKDAELVVEHEVEGDHQELSLELIWKHATGPSAQTARAMPHTAQMAAQIAAQMGATARPEPAMAEWSEPEEANEEEEEEEEDEDEDER